MKPYNITEPQKIQIQRMFNRLAPFYDRFCHTLSFNIDRIWRRKLVNLVAVSNPTNILDIATGTGDVAILMSSRIDNAHIIGIDMSDGMLEIARAKVLKKGMEASITLLQGDAEMLPFDNEQFDVITISFGIRNFENIEKGLSESYRVLKSDGRLFILEFSTPQDRIFGTVYKLYSTLVIPRVGKILSKDEKACKYLPESIVEFSSSRRFVETLENAGFDNSHSISLSNGIAHIYMGVKR